MNAWTCTSLFGRCPLLFAVAALCFACSGSDDQKHDDACTPDDADGIVDEPARFIVTVTDAKFEPAILAAQNSSQVTIQLKNAGTTAHGFVVDCLPTPNSDGCPTQSCFPNEAEIDPLEPNAEATVVFESPLVEGIYTFRSNVPEDTELESGQFIIQ